MRRVFCPACHADTNIILPERIEYCKECGWSEKEFLPNRGKMANTEMIARICRRKLKALEEAIAKSIDKTHALTLERNTLKAAMDAANIEEEEEDGQLNLPGERF